MRVVKLEIAMECDVRSMVCKIRGKIWIWKLDIGSTDLITTSLESVVRA